VTAVRTSDLRSGPPVRSLDFGAGDVPHLTVETNRTCNMRCRVCYNHDRATVKTLDEVKADLDAGTAMRRLSAVTILGGEPTIYPELPEVIAEIKGRGLFCGLLTNGLRFLDEDGPDLIRRIGRAGVDRVYVHVDSGQTHVHPDIDAARERIFSLLEEARVPFALSVTVFDGDAEALPAVIRRYSRFRYFGGVLAVLAYDPDARTEVGPGLAAAYEGLKRELDLDPLSFVPADGDGGEVRWLNYFYFINPRTGSTFPVSSGVERMCEKIIRRAPGWLFFSRRLGPAFLRKSFVPLALAELLRSPRRAAGLFRLARRGGLGLRAQFLVIQSPPKLDYEAGKASVCRHCPDATVRNGRLVPVCIADLVSPLDPAVAPRFAAPAI